MKEESRLGRGGKLGVSEATKNVVWANTVRTMWMSECHGNCEHAYWVCFVSDLGSGAIQALSLFKLRMTKPY